MKIMKDSLAVLATLVLSMGAYAPVLALEAGVSADVSVTAVRADDRAEVSSKASTSARVDSEREDNDEGTSSKTRASSTHSTSTTTSTRSEGDEHRSDVAAFVQSLLKIANRDGGIGAQVRVIANEKASSSTTTVESIAKVETRSALKTFLIGADYKNIGVIRSELAKTDKLLERLAVLASSTTNAQVKADLNAQITLLKADQVKVNAFVTAHENAFSLFGWFVKIFNK
jgi:hypothetical protein